MNSLAQADTNSTQCEHSTLRSKSRTLSCTITAGKSGCFFSMDAINQEKMNKLKSSLIDYCNGKNSIILVDIVNKCRFEALDCNVIRIYIDWFPGMYSSTRRMFSDLAKLVANVTGLRIVVSE